MEQKKKVAAQYSSLTGIHRAVPIILFAVAVFTMFCFITQDIGALGHAISTVFLGLFSYGAYAIPALLALHAVFYPADMSENRVTSRVIFSLVTITFISALAYTITYWNSDLLFNLGEFFRNGQSSIGGGFIGGIVGFCLIKIFGRIGLVILAVAVFAIYISYFFAKGQRSISKFFYNFLKITVIILAYAERGLKIFFGKIVNAKSEKMRRDAEQKSNELTDDDFFAVDNGMQKLSVSELGIKETREDANTLLHEKIFYKSAVSPEEAEAMAMREKAEEMYYAEMERRENEEEEHAVPQRRRLVNLTYDDPDSKIGRTVRNDEPKEEVVIPQPVATSSDDNADAVFTQGFDPFNMMMSEDLASKPSSRSLKDEGVSTKKITEDITELTEADIEREKRVSEFERRKAAILEARKATPANNEGEFKVNPKIVEFHDRTNEGTSDETDEAPTSSFAFDKSDKGTEPPKATPANYTAIGFGDDEPMSNIFTKPAFTSPETIYAYEPPKEEAPKTTVFTVYEAPAVQTKSEPAPYVEEPEVQLFERKTVIDFTPSYAPAVDSTLIAAEPVFEIKTVAEPEIEVKPVAESTVNVEPAEASIPVINHIPDPTPVSEATPVTNTIPVANTAPVINIAPMSETTPVILAEPVIESTPVIETVPVVNVEPEIQAYTTPTPTEEKEEFTYTATKDFNDEKTDEYVPEFKPYQVSAPEDAVVSEVVTAPIEFKAVEPEAVNTLTVEREYVGEENDVEVESFAVEESENDDDAENIIFETPIDTFGDLGAEDEDEEDGEIDELTPPEEDDLPFESEEIPPEERNPVVQGYKDMFSALRDEESEDEEEEADNSYELVSPDEKKEEEAQYDGYDEDEDYDAPPFEHSTVKPEPKTKADVKEEKPEKKKPDFSNYKMPPIDLLVLDPETDDDTSDINENTKILIDTLASFNVTASIKGVDRGPRITRYEVVPARGVKVQSITNLFNDIALNLAKEGIRMEAPIPGKSAIGFEIPNKNPRNVRLRELLECEEFVSAGSKTYAGIGKDVAGNPVFGDIAKYPHALICGATGMGKSVCINSILVSILYKARPDEVKLIMVDPKKVEFRMYSGIPHLLIPVITEAKQAAGALMWAVEEMERRYELIEKHNVRNLEAYNEKVSNDPSLGEKLPKIVIVIDELADLMMMVRDPVEDLIMRIAQKARAAGIHLIIGTQRPSVQVITGAIKANIPSRLSCKVTSQVDSRTIFDMGGAEKLLNRGDMLYWPVDRTKPLRVQGAFVSDSEVEEVMEFLKSQVTEGVYDEEIFAEINKAAQKCGNKKSGGVSADDLDDDGGEECGYYGDQQFLDAVELAIRSKKVSTSLLQRKLSIGYGKAAKYIDAMEEIGIVSEPRGQKPRDVLLTLDEWHEKLSRVDLD